MTTGPDATPIFGPPPTLGQQLFSGGSVLDTRTGIAAAAEQWSLGTSNLDLDDLSFDLLEVSLQRPGPVPEHSAGRRASALMLAGRFREALSALPDDVVLPPPDADDLTRDHLVQATCRAALGDEGAMLWLRQVAPLVSTTDWAGYLAHCLLRVGDARGDRQLSAASLAQLQRLGEKGRRTVPRIAADVVAGRPRGRPEDMAPARRWGRSTGHPMTLAAKQAAEVLRAATDLLHNVSESFVSDPQPVLDTAELLRRGGDPAGAALLLHVVDRTNPHVRRLEEALAAYVPPHAVGRRRLRRGLLLGLGAVVFLVSGLTGYPGAALFWAILVGALEIFARAPGLSRFDTNVANEYAEKAGLRSFFLLPRSVADEQPVGLARPVLPLVLGLVALVLGIVVDGPAVRVARAHGPSTSWLTSPGLSCFLVWVVLFPVLVMWATSLLPSRRLGYAVPRLGAAQLECQCRRWSWVGGPFAFGYSTQHLVAAATPPVLAPVLSRYGPLPPTISSCPTTGAAWLVLTLGPENGKVLLRSPIGSFPDPREAEQDGLSTGQYL